MKKHEYDPYRKENDKTKETGFKVFVAGVAAALGVAGVLGIHNAENSGGQTSDEQPTTTESVSENEDQLDLEEGVTVDSEGKVENK